MKLNKNAVYTLSAVLIGGMVVTLFSLSIYSVVKAGAEQTTLIKELSHFKDSTTAAQNNEKVYVILRQNRKFVLMKCAYTRWTGGQLDRALRLYKSDSTEIVSYHTHLNETTIIKQ